MINCVVGGAQVRGVRAQHEGAGAAEGPAGRGSTGPGPQRQRDHQDGLNMTGSFISF